MGHHQQTLVVDNVLKTPICKPKCRRMKPRACKSVTRRYYSSNNNVSKGKKGKTKPRVSNPEATSMESWMENLSMYNRPETISSLESITLGSHHITTWYDSAYPTSVVSASESQKHLVICESCLAYTPSKSALAKHTCSLSHPPGNVVYKESTDLAVFKVDGAVEQTYCQNLCLLAKCFMEQKTLYFDVQPFLFYVFCERKHNAWHPVGYFSKEKECEKYNLSCIVVLPPYQRFGYGKLMISLSYQISVLEGKTGSPEKPLSGLGRKSYMAYWKSVILSELVQHHQLSIEDLGRKTGICATDLMDTLVELGVLKSQRSSKADARHSVAKSTIVDMLSQCKAFRTADPASIIKI